MDTLIRAAELEIDGARRQALRGGTPLTLEPKAFSVLLYLAERRDRVVSKEELFAAVWPDVAVTDNALTRVIAQLRRELGDDAKSPRYIATVMKTGYRFIAEVEGVKGPPRSGAPRRWAVAAVIAAAGVLIAGAMWRTRRTAEWLPAPRFEQVTNTTALDVSPTLSPDGSQVVFASNRTGRFQLYLRTISGGVERQLTDLNEDAIHPAWSPDGRWIAFVLGPRATLSVMPAEGGAVRALPASGSFPAWSPDSRRLVFRVGMATTAREVASFENTNLMTIGLDASAAQALTTANRPPGGHNTPVWLADGRRVLFCATLGDNHSQPWTVDVTTGETRQFATIPAAVLNARLTPDGSWLYFSSLAGLMRQRLPGGKPETLVAAGAQMARDLALSRDGRRLVFSQVNDQTTLWKAPLDGSGEAGPFLDETGVRATAPAFSPDGKSLAYSLLRRGGRMSIQLAEAGGRGSRPVSSPEAGAFSPVWTRNGELGYMLLSKSGPAYWVQPPQSAGRPLPLKLDRRLVRRVKLSPDGRWLAGQYGEIGAPSRVFVSDTTTGEARFVTPASRDIGYPVWFPDSRRLAAEERVDSGTATELVTFSSAGGSLRTLVKERVHNWPHDVAPDGETIALSGLRDGVWNIYTVSGVSGHVRQVTKFTGRALLVRYPAFARGRPEVVFEYGESKGNVYVAELR